MEGTLDMPEDNSRRDFEGTSDEEHLASERKRWNLKIASMTTAERARFDERAAISMDIHELGIDKGIESERSRQSTEREEREHSHKQGGPLGSKTGPPYDWAKDPDMEESGQHSFRPLIRRFKRNR